MFRYICIALILVAVFGGESVRLTITLSCIVVALIRNKQVVASMMQLMCLTLLTFIPFLLIIQSSICSTGGIPIVECSLARATPIFAKVISIFALTLLVIAYTWRGNVLRTVNALTLPRPVRIMVVISSAMVGEFRKAMFRVHHAFTSSGQASPSMHVRNILVLPRILAGVWASVVWVVDERLNQHWSSDTFWDHFIPR